jgi:hypothetical protein
MNKTYYILIRQDTQVTVVPNREGTSKEVYETLEQAGYVASHLADKIEGSVEIYENNGSNDPVRIVASDGLSPLI